MHLPRSAMLSCSIRHWTVSGITQCGDQPAWRLQKCPECLPMGVLLRSMQLAISCRVLDVSKQTTPR